MAQVSRRFPPPGKRQVVSLQSVIDHEVALKLQEAQHADVDPELELALRLSALEAEAAQAAASTAAAAPAPAPAADDDDYALALRLQLEEERAAAAASARVTSAPVHSHITSVSAAEQQWRGLVSASGGRRDRKLYSADDADAFAGGADDAGAHPFVELAREVKAARDEDARLARAARGRGALSLAAAAAAAGPGALAPSALTSASGGGDPVAPHGDEPQGHRSSAMAATGLRNARTLERRLGPAAGDLSGVCVSAPAVSTLQRHMQKQMTKGVASRGNVEGGYHATQDSVLDRRTRMILFKLVSAGRLESVAGVVATGKEANVYRGVGWSADVHRALAEEGWWGQNTRVWDAEDEEEEEGSEGEGSRQVDEDGPTGSEADPTAAVAVATAEAVASHRAASHPAASLDSLPFDDPSIAARVDLETPVVAAAAAAGGAPTAAAWSAPDDEEDDPPAAAAAAHTARSAPPPPTGVSSGCGDSNAALKIFKTTLNEFRDRRDYMDGDRRYAKVSIRRHNPRSLISAWAEKEWKNLIRVHRAGIPSPAPLLLRGHVIAMSFLGEDGWPWPQLRDAPLRSAKAWRNAYAQVVTIMHALYHWCHLVHADLSEYNLLVAPPEPAAGYPRSRVHVIDLGQAVDTSHPNAPRFLAADAANVTAFFARRGVHDVLPAASLVRLIEGGRALAPHPPAYAERTGAGAAPSAGSGLRRTRVDEEAHALGSSFAPVTAVTAVGTVKELSHDPLPSAAQEVPGAGGCPFDGDAGAVALALFAAMEEAED